MGEEKDVEACYEQLTKLNSVIAPSIKVEKKTKNFHGKYAQIHLGNNCGTSKTSRR